MKKFKVLVAMTSFFALPVLAGHLTIDNHTNTSLSAVCGHHGDQGKTHHLIEPGHKTQISVYGDHHGKANCQAIDHHGKVIASRTFDFHHGNEIYNWEVNRQH